MGVRSHDARMNADHVKTDTETLSSPITSRIGTAKTNDPNTIINEIARTVSHACHTTRRPFAVVSVPRSSTLPVTVTTTSISTSCHKDDDRAACGPSTYATSRMERACSRLASRSRQKESAADTKSWM